MAMTSFEKAIINELKGINKELHELNRKKPEQGQVDGKTLDNSLNIGDKVKVADNAEVRELIKEEDPDWLIYNLDKIMTIEAVNSGEVRMKENIWSWDANWIEKVEVKYETLDSEMGKQIAIKDIQN